MIEPSNHGQRRSRGRPPGPPTTVINIRLTQGLLERLDQYIDYELRWSHEGDINRTTITREALDAFLSAKGY